METTVTQLANKFDGLSGRMELLSQRFDELLAFLQEHVATKENLKAFATKEDLKRELTIMEMDLIDRTDVKLLDLKNDLIRRFSPSAI